MDFSERLKTLRLEAGVTQTYVADQLNLSYQAYAKYELGKGKPRAKNLEKLAEIFDVSVSYLLGETDVRDASEIAKIMEQLNEERQKNVISYAFDQLEKQRAENNVLSLSEHRPIYKVEVEETEHLSAGTGYAYTSDVETTTVYTDKEYNFDIARWIDGDSMEPDYHNWDVALIKLQPTLDYDGQICVIDDTEHGKGYIKSVFLEDDGLRLVSLNEKSDSNGNRIYPDIVIPFENNPRIVGKVIGSFTPIEQ